MADLGLRAAADAALRSVIGQAVEPDGEAVAAALTAARVALPREDLPALVEQVRQSLVGYGELQSLVRPGVSDILVNSPSSVWTDSAAGLRREETSFESEADVRRLAFRLAALAGRRLDESQPFVDGLLPDGVRLQAAIPPVSVAGTCLSLRLPSRSPLPMDDWLVEARLRAELSPVLAGEASFVISGTTGAGKTTLLRSVLHHWPRERRVVCIEDVKELDLHLPNAVMLQGRAANAEGNGTVTMAALVRHAMRMRPDSIIVGEVRGPEVVDWLLAISSGHTGSASTVHADSSGGALRRLLLLAELAGVPRATAAAVVADAVDYVVHVRRVADRRLISEVASVSDLLARADDDG